MHEPVPTFGLSLTHSLTLTAAARHHRRRRPHPRRPCHVAVLALRCPRRPCPVVVLAPCRPPHRRPRWGLILPGPLPAVYFLPLRLCLGIEGLKWIEVY
jgi:hypothetical protein